MPRILSKKVAAETITTTITRLQKIYKQRGALERDSAFETLVLVVLSARTKDEQILKLAPALFKKFPNIATLAAAQPQKVEPYLSSIGLYRQKAKNIVRLAQLLQERHHGEVPKTMAELTALPGVGRKTASVVLAACFNIPAIAVDTHVHRLANRLGVVRTQTAEQTERTLLALVPLQLQGELNRVGVPFGREICQPRTPHCSACPLQDICSYYASTNPRR
jgi:endonuclease-3